MIALEISVILLFSYTNHMVTWFKKQTLAFFVACFLAAPAALFLLVALIGWVVGWINLDESALLIPASYLLFAALVINAVLGLLIFSIYRKNRVALALSVVVYPLLWGLEIGGVRERNRVLDTVIVAVSLLAAAAIAGVYVRELRRNWR